MTPMKTIKKDKKKKKKKNYFIYLFWLGPMLSIMGITARVVAGAWSPIASGLLITGLVIIGLWLIFSSSLAPGFWGRRSTQAGTNALIATLAMVVILGLINFLGVRYGQRIDLTENQLFSLSPLSQWVMKNLQQPIKVWIFSPTPNPADLELLKNYRRYGSKMEYEYVDPELKPGLAEKFNVKLGDVYLEYGSKREFVQAINADERLSEVRLTNSIEKLTSDRLDKVYFLEGHKERLLENVEGGISAAVNALKDKNFIPLPLNLVARSEVPNDASLVIVAGPERALFDAEVQALRNYLIRGGSLMLMIDPQINAGLDSLLADWGVKLANQIVIDASSQERLVNPDPETPLVANYGNHPITKEFTNQFSLYPLARPVETTPVKGVEETPLLLTDQKSWGESTLDKQPRLFEPQNGDRPGPLMIGVALSRKTQPPSALPKPTPQATISPGASPSASPSVTGQTKASPTSTPQATISPKASPSVSPSAAGQPKASPTPTPQASISPKASPSVSSSVSGQPKASPTPTPQASISPKASPSVSPSVSGQTQASATPTPQASISPGASPSVSPSVTGQPQASPSSANEAKSDKKSTESRMVVIGNSSFIANGLFEQPALNSDVFLNSVSWLSKRDNQPLSIRPKEQKNRRINLTLLQVLILGGTAVFIMPLLGLLTALVIWWRRR